MSQRSIYEIQADLCRSMASATRIRIVHVLRDEPQRVGDIARLIGLPPTTVSRHLGVLRNGGIVIAQRRARGTLYQIANLKIVHRTSAQGYSPALAGRGIAPASFPGYN